jgi:hypothetical protein
MPVEWADFETATEDKPAASWDEFEPVSVEDQKKDLVRKMAKARLEGKQGEMEQAAVDLAQRAAYTLSLPAQPIVRLPRSSGTGAGAGAVNVAAGVAEGLTAPAYWMVPGSKAVQLAAGSQMLGNLPQSVPAAVQTVQDPNATMAQKVEAGAAPVLESAFGAGMLGARLPRWQVQPPPDMIQGSDLQMPPGARPAPEPIVPRPAPPGRPVVPETPAAPPAPSDAVKAILAKPVESVTHQDIAGLSTTDAAEYFRSVSKDLQKRAVISGLKLTPADVPELKRLRDVSLKKLLEAVADNDNDAVMAEQGRNIWYSGAIEGANKAGPNYDPVMQERAAAEPAPKAAAPPAPVAAEPPPVSATKPAEVAAKPEQVADAGTQQAQAAISKTVTTEGVTSGKEAKSTLVETIQKQIEEAPPESQFIGVVAERERMAKDKFGIADSDFWNKAKQKIGTVTIEIPGDGTFTVLNTKEALGEVLARAKRISTKSTEPAKVTRRGASAEDKEWIAQQFEEVPEPATGPTQMMSGFPLPAALNQALNRGLQVARGVLAQRIKARPTRHAMDQLADGADTMANNFANQMGNRIRVGIGDVEDRAAAAVIAAKFDPANLPALVAAARKGKNKDAETALIYAANHWPQVSRKATQGAELFEDQLKAEQAAGIETEARENYLPGIYDTDLWMGQGRPFIIGRGAGLSSSFRKGKTYNSPFEAIADGYVPKSLKLSDLVEHRIRQGQRLMNRTEWGNALRTFTDPTDGRPIVTDLQTRSRGPGRAGFETAPEGYVPREILPGRRVAVHEDYAKLFDALTGKSAIAEFEPGGLPVGEAALKAAGTVKHGLLLFDTFHASRVAQREMSLKGLPSYRKGLSLLEYSDRDLGAAVRAGEITQEMADYARANRGTANLLMRNGLNVGRIQEAMYSGLVRSIQETISKEAQKAGVPKGLAEKVEFNKWVFEKMSRGAMLESGLIEFERVQKDNPTWTQEQVARKVARDINVFFGNLGRQGLFKSQTMLDLSRLAMLAPQWVESMARTELKAAKGLTIDPILNRTTAVGTVARGVRNGLLAYFVGTQILNQFTRGQFTWQNPEKDHKLDAWIPDLTGKSNGYFLSPFSVVTELSHDLYRNIEKGQGLAEGLGRTALGKAGPLTRAAIISIMGRYPFGNEQKIVGTWDRAKAAGMALAPVPIPLTPAVQGAPPGQMQRQAMSSMGLKTELAGSAQQQVHGLVRDWMRTSEDPRLVKRYEQQIQQEFGPSDYTPLRQMLANGDLEKARDAFDKLLPVHGKSKVNDALNPFRHPFAGSRINESKFKRSLTDAERDIYDSAVNERKQIWSNYQRMLRGEK